MFYDMPSTYNQWFFDQRDPSTLTLMENVCEPQLRSYWKISHRYIMLVSLWTSKPTLLYICVWVYFSNGNHYLAILLRRKHSFECIFYSRLGPNNRKSCHLLITDKYIFLICLKLRNDILKLLHTWTLQENQQYTLHYSPLWQRILDVRDTLQTNGHTVRSLVTFPMCSLGNYVLVLKTNMLCDILWIVNKLGRWFVQ